MSTDPSKPKFKSLYQKNDLCRPTDCFRSKNHTVRKPYSADTASDYARIIHSSVFRQLQGKTQLFPAGESELLRTRLTHSLEVAEVASRIATKINQQQGKKHKIDLSIVAAASLAHDLGHPPFGHTGEKILNEKMKGSGGFEGNAQTLRIITRLENRISSHHPVGVTPATVEKDPRGLNLLYRTIAATIKRDKMIPFGYDRDEIEKGYYQVDCDIVLETKKMVLGREFEALDLRTIECQIMDLADDIAYSTYDLEDCMIAGISTPLDLMSCSQEVLEKISKEVTKHFRKNDRDIRISTKDVLSVFMSLFEFITILGYNADYDFDKNLDRSVYLAKTYRESKLLASTPMFRRRFSELLINNAIDSVSVNWNEKIPVLSQIIIGDWERLVIECLKAYNYITVISSQRLQLRVRKCRQIIRTLFDELNEERGIELVDDNKKTSFQLLINSKSQPERMRFICDYIASMTDRKAIEIYSKIRSANHVSVFGLEEK